MTEAPAAHRYAIYFAPRQGTRHWELGSQWLGRCANSRAVLRQPDIDGVSSGEFHQITAAPRRYGWHATLKAPFALAAGVDVLGLHRAMQQVARGLLPFRMPPLEVRRIGNFLALVPEPSHEANALVHAAAAACVTQLHAMSAPLPASEIARRRASGLTPRQEELLQSWSYPFVLEEFRFHMSITGNLDKVSAATQTLVTHAASQFFSGFDNVEFDSLALFAEPSPGADFVFVDHVELSP